MAVHTVSHVNLDYNPDEPKQQLVGALKWLKH